MISSKIARAILIASLFLDAQITSASGTHEEPEASKDEDHGHESEVKHDEGEEGHAHGEKGETSEESKAVGPDKGIIEANESSGFKLSEEAWKNFGIKTIEANGPGLYVLLRKSIFFGLQERNVYRLRDGFFKRVDFVTQSKSATEYKVQIHDLRAGDKIVISGLGYLRIAEIAAFGGVGEGHSH